MPRTALTPKTALGSKSSAYASANVADLTMAAADVANKNEFAASGHDLIFAHNTTAGPETITVTSVADPQQGRTGDVTAYSLGAGEYAVLGPFHRAGWQQTNGKIYIEASNIGVKLGVVQV
jgi:hypothetical protein